MVATLAIQGTELIPKTPINSTVNGSVKKQSLLWDHIAIAELEALGERHLGCGHEV